MTAPAPAAGPAGDFGRPPSARLAFDAHTWKEIAHLLLNLPLAVVGFVYAVTVLSVSGGLTVTVLGLPLLAGSLLGARLLG
ncbi:sensor histidine kinase, partial [Streptomyces sp. SID1328]|uniref:sensor domain-containing protein n=1 Tax=Streptomyces sp. SID1328 TaxID=2690250 RepID=UPI00139393A8